MKMFALKMDPVAIRMGTFNNIDWMSIIEIVDNGLHNNNNNGLRAVSFLYIRPSQGELFAAWYRYIMVHAMSW